jgi:hypothetical protein
MPYNVAVCTENREDKEYKNILEMLKEITEEDSIYTAITFPAGRALEELGYSKYQTSKEPPISACSAGSSPMVFPDGKVIACIGPVIGLQSSHPLLLGSLRENTLQEILDKAELNPVLHAIRIWGPKKLISIIEEAGLGQHLPKEYIGNSVCNACYNLMSSPRIVEFFAQLAEDTEFRQKVAYARLYYLKESEMIERCQSINSKETV